MGKTILISGAASGIGLEFLRHYSAASSNTVCATDRSTIPQAEACAPNVECFLVDVSDPSDLERLQGRMSAVALDLVIHSAGIRGLVPAVEDTHPDHVAACETLDVMDVDTMRRTFEINTIGTFSLIRTLLPSLRLASDAQVVVMSSRMGSLAANVAGSAYAYRASKAALNAVVKSFSIDVPEVTFVLCHPGRVETKLVKTREEGAISPQESVRSMATLIESFTHSHSGGFFDRFGKRIEW